MILVSVAAGQTAHWACAGPYWAKLPSSGRSSKFFRPFAEKKMPSGNTCGHGLGTFRIGPALHWITCGQKESVRLSAARKREDAMETKIRLPEDLSLSELLGRVSGENGCPL